MKRRAWILIVLALALSLWGCGGTPAETTAPTVPTTLPVTEPTEPPIVLEAVNTLSFRGSKERPSVCILDARNAAFLTTEYRSGDYASKCTRVQVVDLYTDELKCETLLEGAFTGIAYGGAEGYLSIINAEDNRVLVLDAQLQQVLEFRAEDPVGALTGDLSRYYYTYGNLLFCQDTATGEARDVSLAYEIDLDEIRGWDEDQGILLATAFEDPYTTTVCMAAVKPESGEFTLLYKDLGDGKLTPNGGIFSRFHTEELYADLYFCDWTDEALLKLPEFLVNDPVYSTWHIGGSDYVCKLTYDEAQNVTVVDCQLYRIGQTVTVCSLKEQLGSAKFNEILALPDGNLLALSLSPRGCQGYLICPDKLSFTEADIQQVQAYALVDTAVADNYAKQEAQALPESLQNARQTADRLEAAYDVTILLSNQCAIPAAQCGMPITTTDVAELPNEVELIEAALAELEEVLKLYPESFFDQFQNEAGQRGIMVLLVEEISDERGVIGVSYVMGQWYPVAVDITSGEVRHTYCHEFWHATENRIADLNETALDLVAYAACNPSDFFYSGDTTSEYIKDTRYTYFYGNMGEDVYFVDPYAKTNSKEDRARLMEYVMCTENVARDMLKHPALRRKLNIMCEAIDKVFDTTGWEDAHWLRFN